MWRTLAHRLGEAVSDVLEWVLKLKGDPQVRPVELRCCAHRAGTLRRAAPSNAAWQD